MTAFRAHLQGEYRRNAAIKEGSDFRLNRGDEALPDKGFGGGERFVVHAAGG